MNEQINFQLHRAAISWVRDSLKSFGFRRTACDLSLRLAEFLRDLSPERRRMRYGDLQFDFDHGTDTSWSNITLRTRIRELFSGEPYQPIEPEQFHEMFSSLPINFRDYTFIDMGSGKGRALLLASEYPFHRIVGVEVLPELHAIAKLNFEKYSTPSQQCSTVQFWCGDARDFAFPEEQIFLYLFNPFFEPVLRDVITKAQASLAAHPRPFVLMYVNPILEHVVQSTTFLQKVAGTHQYSVYTNFAQLPSEKIRSAGDLF